MNHPDEPENELLASARRTLTAASNTFELKPWRELMTTKNASAAAKAKTVKAAAMKVAKKTPPYKHVPTGDDHDDHQADTAASAFGAFAQSQLGKGVDSTGSGVVQSNFPSTTKDPKMDKTAQELADEKAKASAAKQAEKEAAAKAKLEAKEKAQAEKKAAAEAKAKERAEAKAKRDAEKAAEKESRPPRERTYDGSMTALAERVRSGTYVKGVNGQLRSNDDVAIALESVPAKKVVPMLLEVFQITNPYEHLNYGQQSMNLRNRLRGALRKGVEVGEGDKKVKLTLDYVKQVRDDGGYATAEAEAAEKAAAKAETKTEEAATAS